MNRRLKWFKAQGRDYAIAQNEKAKEYQKTLIGWLQLRAGRTNKAAENRGQTDKLTGADLLAIWLKQNGYNSFACACAVCGLKAEEWQIDHVIPICRGGKHSAENIQIICAACHAIKSNCEKVEIDQPALFQ